MSENKEAKKWYQSKAVWLGVSAIVIAVLTAIDQGVSWPQAALAGVGAAGILIRAVTSIPLGK